MVFKIRKMKAEDFDEVSRIYAEGVNRGNANFETNLPSWNDWIEEIILECNIVAYNDDIIMGWASLSSISKREVYKGVVEDSIYVDQKYRRKGIGTILLKELIRLSEEKGIWTIESRIFPENRISINLHKKHGFRIVGTHEKLGKMNGKWRDVTIMERRSKNVGI